ncbi:MAG TPA: carotenoid oxygenase family protein, partial [Thermomonospora sp.]|nr:carotenoid oxygenase family protein [Thermomonospora sp.]
MNVLPVPDHFARFISPQESEVSVEALPVDGAIPEWLTGTLLRNGPAYYGAGRGGARHLFDGLAMLHKFAFTDGRVSYANRFLRTRSYRALREDGRIGYREFASDPCRRLTLPIASLFDPGYSDNTNVNVIRLGARLVALTETPLPIAFDPETLETLGVAYDPPGRGVRSPTAHPHFDAAGSMITLQVHFGVRSSYRLYRHTPTGFRLLARIPVRQPAYVHSFALTERHIVLAEAPFRIRPLELATARRPFIENYRWLPEQGTTFLVVDRHTGRLTGRWQAGPMFCFHHVNAYDDPSGDIVVDLCAYEDPSIIDATYLDTLHEGRTPIPAGRLRRYRLRPGGATQEETVSPTPFEWPRVNYRAVNSRPYRYAYGAGTVHDGVPAPAITKLDLSDGSAIHWHDRDHHPGEPVFVPGPGRRGEDDGVLLSVVFDPA